MARHFVITNHSDALVRNKFLLKHGRRSVELEVSIMKAVVGEYNKYKYVHAVESELFTKEL